MFGLSNTSSHTNTDIPDTTIDTTGIVRSNSTKTFLGITNFGNTCYNNSLLQALASSPSFMNVIRTLSKTMMIQFKTHSNQKMCATLELLFPILTRLAEPISTTNRNELLSNQTILKVLMYQWLDTFLMTKRFDNAWAQQDPDELYVSILIDITSYIQSCLPDYYDASNLYGLCERSSITCLHCHDPTNPNPHYKPDVVLDTKLELSFPEGMSTDTISIHDLLVNSLISEERRPHSFHCVDCCYNFRCSINESNNQLCSAMLDIPQLHHNFDVFQYRGVVIEKNQSFIYLGINRFKKHNINPNETEKIHTKVIFPSNGIFNITDCNQSTSTWKVVSVVIHTGNTLHEGHYWTANQYGIFNDDIVTHDSTMLTQILKTGQSKQGNQIGQGYIYILERVTDESTILSTTTTTTTTTTPTLTNVASSSISKNTMSPPTTIPTTMTTVITSSTDSNQQTGNENLLLIIRNIIQQSTNDNPLVRVFETDNGVLVSNIHVHELKQLLPEKWINDEV